MPHAGPKPYPTDSRGHRLYLNDLVCYQGEVYRQAAVYNLHLPFVHLLTLQGLPHEVEGTDVDLVLPGQLL